MRKPLLVAVLVAAAARLAAQETPDQQAKRLLEDGRSYLAQGKQKQALDNFNIVVSSFPSTDSVGSVSRTGPTRWPSRKRSSGSSSTPSSSAP